MLTRRMAGTTHVSIHGRRALVNTGFAAPAFHRRWPNYNAPLVAAVAQTHLTLERPLTVVDVGAAIGDTALLLLEKCPGAIARCYCFEPDAEFYECLVANLGSEATVTVSNAMLAGGEGVAQSLERIHSGTASAQGDHTVATTTLDLELADADGVDVLKIDTDGFDGAVLAGATSILRTHHPTVVFEWHPLLADATGQAHARPFEVLAAAGYRTFVWFTKEGDFSHLAMGYSREGVEATARVCRLGLGPRPDWHYDIVALSESSPVDPTSIAGLGKTPTVIS